MGIGNAVGGDTRGLHGSRGRSPSSPRGRLPSTYGLRRDRLAVLLLTAAAAVGARTPLIPEHPAVLRTEAAGAWRFDRPEEAWPVLANARAAVTAGVLRVESGSNDPMLKIPVPPVEGPLCLRWRMRGAVQGPAELFWASEAHPGLSADRSARAATTGDGEWHEYRIELPIPERYTLLRFDPATSAGTVEIDDVSVERTVRHPLQFERLDVSPDLVRGLVRNTTSNLMAFTMGGGRYEAPPGGAVECSLTLTGRAPFEAVTVRAESADLSPLERVVYVHRPGADTDWITMRSGDAEARVARDGSGARLLWKGRAVAVACPLAQRNGVGVPWRLVQADAQGAVLAGGIVESMAIRLDGSEVVFEVRAREPVTGPSLRALGAIEQGLLCGVEHLGAGEVSSSKLDVERSEHLRYEPDPMLVTMPLASFVTDLGSVAMVWDDPLLRPVFSTPNRYDSTPDHLMAVKGDRMVVRVRLGDGWTDGGRLEDAILWAVRRRGLPAPPPAPRTPEQQRALNTRALTTTMRDANGWFHAKWADSKSAFFVDQASTFWRLTGALPSVPRLVPNGAHVDNDAAYLVTGRAPEWIAKVRGAAENARREQKPDGSFRYDGKYYRGHFEDTASGLCALKALPMLDSAYYLGDAVSLVDGVKTLEYMKRFRVPRGAQTWEMPLHTPDVFGAGLLVRAYVRGFELTGNREYLDLARRWALSGLPFVYQWECRPVMRYATIGVLGATDWTGVVWIGLPVQWCGTVYAYALTELAPHDDTLDWRRVAEGILVCSEQMQYPDGEYAGALPDSFSLADQRRNPAAVNPCVLVALRLRLAGELDALAAAAAGRHRVVAPFPVTIRDGRAVVNGRAGVAYEAVIDGTRVEKVASRGEDRIDLDPPPGR